MDAMRRGFDTITVATCGNYGAAMALAARFAGLCCRIYIPQNYHTYRVKEMTDLGAEILRVPGDYEHAVAASGDDARQHDFYDANPGGSNTMTSCALTAESPMRFTTSCAMRRLRLRYRFPMERRLPGYTGAS